MSGEVVGWAMKQTTGNPAAKLVLAKLADNANEQGLCWPSIDLIIQHTELGQSTVYKHLATLEALELIKPIEIVVRGEPQKGFQLSVPNAEREIPPRGKAKVAIPPGGNDTPAGGKSTPPAGMHIEEPSIEPSMNRHSLAPDGAGESENVASLREAEPERFQEFRSAWAQEMPDGFPAKDEATARAEFGRQTRLTEADTLIAAARLHGAAETARHKGRRGGDFRTKLPSNWLKDGGWEGYVRQITENADREKNTTLALVRVQEALGHGLFEILRHQLKLPDYTIAALDGATYEPGPPPVLAGTGVQRIILERHTFALQRALGEDLEIVVSGAGRRSA